MSTKLLSPVLALACIAAAAAGDLAVLKRIESLPAPRRAGFTSLAPELSGILFTNTLAEHRAATNRTLYNGSGVAAGDIDGDGLPDLVFAGLEHQLQVFKNLGNLRFTNWTGPSGLSVANLHLRGVVLADIDGSGSLDLLATANNRGVLCFLNDGHGKFRETTPTAGTSSPFGSMTLALADVDGNGTLDLYVANNRTDDMRDRGEVQLSMIGGKPAVPPSLRNRLVIFKGQLLEYGEPDALLLNDGAGRFTQANWTNGTFLDHAGRPLPGAPLDWGLTATFRDFNGDRAPDLYVCNDFWTEDRIWINDGRGRFRAADPFAFRHTSGSSMGVDLADLDADGFPEIFVLDMLSRSHSWRKRQMDAQPSAPYIPGVHPDRPQVLRNTLFHARGDGTYAEIADYARVPAAEWAWQPMFVDVDLDGLEDLIVTTGHARDLQDRDANAAIRMRQRSYASIANADERRKAFQADLLANMQLYPELTSPVVMFRNEGGMRFRDVTDQWGTEFPRVHHGFAMADFDLDGDLDMAVNTLNTPAVLYRNDSAAPRVAVRLRGRAPNTQAIGAKVLLKGGAAPSQSREVVAGGRYLSGSDTTCVFAAGDSGKPMTLEIEWRDGSRSVFANLLANHLYEVRQGGAAAVAPAPADRAALPWFSDASRSLNHAHHDALFDDFTRQPLLPVRFSHLGPGVCWTDLNDDGWDDLVIGSGAGTPLGVFQNDRQGGFKRLTNGAFGQPLHRDSTAIVASAADGKRAILAGLANYEDGRTNTASVFRYDLQNASRIAALPDLPSSIGPLAAADFDADNDLDLFAGARVAAANWPAAAGTRILRKDGESWTPFELGAEILGQHAPISAAIWTDLERDGFPELVIAGELGPIRIFKNQNGELQPADFQVRLPDGRSFPLSELTGWWISLAAGDFDGDGALDLAAGNWGENSIFHATSEHPLTFFSGRFDAAGANTTVIEAAFDHALKAYVPARSMDELAMELPFLKSRFDSHRKFGEAAIEQAFAPELGKLRKHQAAFLQSAILLNRKEHFELRPLPVQAQFAPVFGLVVADFDMDGKEDLFAAQNFFGMRPGVPRLDAGRGLMLRGQGNGEFDPVPGPASGVVAYGEQRGAATADFNQDGRPDLLLTQNGGETKLFRNETAKRGLRVRISGPPGNPDGIGCVVRLKRGSLYSPAREVRAGSGYWSQDSAVPVLADPAPASSAPLEVEVRWPGGSVYLVQVPAPAPPEQKIAF